MGPRLRRVTAPRTLPPALVTAIPGPRSRALAARLARVESRNVTCLAPEAPIFWERARARTSGTPTATATSISARASASRTSGTRTRAWSRRCAEQARALLHGDGRRAPGRGQGGAARGARARAFRAAARRAPCSAPRARDAVEVALKTALLATGRAGVVAFEGAYHGLTLGALDATWRRDFREPFAARLADAHRRSRASATSADVTARGARVRRADRRGASSSRSRAAAASASRRAASCAALRALLRRRGLAADRRRGLHRLRPHRPLVRVRARGRRAGPAVRRQGPRVGHADLGVHRPRAT